MECYSYLRYIQDRLSDGKHHTKGDFGNPFGGPRLFHFSLVENLPISTKDHSRIHQFGKKVLPGIYLGYVLYAGWEERIW